MVMDTADTALLLRYVRGSPSTDGHILENADVNDDGTITAIDAIPVRRMALSN